jgi:hypothetical protein
MNRALPQAATAINSLMLVGFYRTAVAVARTVPVCQWLGFKCRPLFFQADIYIYIYIYIMSVPEIRDVPPGPVGSEEAN